MREFVQQPLVNLDQQRTDHASTFTTHATQPRTFDRVHKWEDFVPEACKFLRALDNTKRLCQPQVRPYVLVTQLAMQGIPLRIAIYLLQMHALNIVDEPLIAADDVKEVRGYIFGLLRSLTAIAPYCGLREHLILHACRCTACHACFQLCQALVFLLHAATCKHWLQLYTTTQARTVKLYCSPGPLSIQGLCHFHCTK